MDLTRIEALPLKRLLNLFQPSAHPSLYFLPSHSDEGTFVESSAETLFTMLDTADLIRLVLISSCSNQMITFEPENLFWAETDGAVLSVHVPVHEAGDRHESRKQ